MKPRLAVAWVVAYLGAAGWMASEVLSGYWNPLKINLCAACAMLRKMRIRREKHL